MRSIGFCLGASTISSVVMDQQGHLEIVERIAHEGNAKEVFRQLFYKLYSEGDRVAVTGRKMKSSINLPTVSEPEAVEMAYHHLGQRYPDIGALISAGGETFLVYELDVRKKIKQIYTGNKCAAGTGEFFLQQVKRMDLSVAEAVRLADLTSPYPVAGRCSVFCKSDCTHALNKGQPKGHVIAGLAQMMAGKILELLKNCSTTAVMLVGGVAQNLPVVDFLQKRDLMVIIPKEAAYFEALGAALWASERQFLPSETGQLFQDQASSFSFLPALEQAQPLVIFKDLAVAEAQQGERCYLGLDVGSTTTKAVVLREKGLALAAKVYLRTNGDPVQASRRCYAALQSQLPADLKIVGLGVTGSGRQIAGLHALTEGVINEIIAHAAAAVHFDPQVDTIFEIGGQDAKYTLINNRVPVDYAMNEACSAGTGSFLEEAAYETLDIDMESIADLALAATRPPNFSDQCAAFIGSDIKNAVHEGLKTNDIVAGLVYSICFNYVNRVKGARPIGQKVFMQGGVCYNRAVPVAMASLIGKEIVVPPEPGLMGAFGVALEVKQRIEQGLLAPGKFVLKDLAQRELTYGRDFVCRGGKEACDRRCLIKTVVIEGKRYPFGGACNKYVNLTRRVNFPAEELNLVNWREKLLLEKYARVEHWEAEGPLIGISKSLLTNIFYPLYFNFFKELGCKVLLGRNPIPQGMERKGAAFCYPVELAHGIMEDLLSQAVDYIFLSHVKGMEIENGNSHSVTCPFVQGEPYYLKAAFPESSAKLLTPVLDFTLGWEQIKSVFLVLGRQLGFSTLKCKQAFQLAVEKQLEFQQALQAKGSQLLEELQKRPEEKAVVIFGRPYNALAGEANMNIPHKLASRGWRVISLDMLSLEEEAVDETMYWSMGQLILKGARFIRKHPQLFGVYLTNFSCGPDSFVTGYFREIMGEKPSLTLELDAHTADAGLDTRIEAFIDVVESYLKTNPDVSKEPSGFVPAATVWQDGKFQIKSSESKLFSLQASPVKVVFPSMGNFGTRALAAAFHYHGVKAVALEPPGEKEHKLGKNYTSCKECLPLMLTTGSLLRYLQEERPAGEITACFMPKTSGPCRFGQYHVALEKVIEREQLRDVALISLSSENSYAGMPTAFVIRAWRSVIITDVLEEIQAAVLALAEETTSALAIYRQAEELIIDALASEPWKNLRGVLLRSAKLLAGIPLKNNLSDALKVLLTGEIYVRKDDFSRKSLVERLAALGIVTKTAPVSEWLYYTDYLVEHNLLQKNSLAQRSKVLIQGVFKRKIETEIKQILAISGLYEPHLVNISQIINRGKNLISPALTGETILTIGSSLLESMDKVDGVIAIGPFGCMPNRMAEAILGQSSKGESTPAGGFQPEPVAGMPFLAIETDGNPFPQLVEAKLEAFALQVLRKSDLSVENT